ncbi:HtaA domain-containing protein, partial [Conexibacter sp. JD483]|uniref:HtaA domain-containing protein n=2 Tax=Conexibacter TaxID=191494 RepID=UPI00286FEC1B
MERSRSTRRSPLHALIVAVALLAVLIGAAPALAAPTPITAGTGLDWGVKASWRNYIGVDGTTLSDGVTRNADGTFHFPVSGGSYDADTRETVVQFGGTLVFLGHCERPDHGRPCALDMTLRKPRVELTEDGGYLYAEMESRPIEGGEIIVHENVRLAVLGLEDATPLVRSGRTTWTELTATMAPEGSAVFTYGVGTVIDPVSFGYTGPGGKPAGEVWSAPALATYSAATLNGAAAATRIAGSLGSDAAVVRVNGGFAVVDPATLQPKAPVVAADVVRGSLAADPVSRTIFAQLAGGDRRIVVYTWDGTALTGGGLDGSEGSGMLNDGARQGAGIWDAAANRYVVFRTFGDRTDAWQVRRDGSGVWVASRIATVKNADGTTYGGQLSYLALVPNGSGGTMIVGAPWGAGQLLRVAVSNIGATVSPLAQSAGLEPMELYRTTRGLYGFNGTDVIWYPFTGSGTTAALGSGERVKLPGAPQFIDLNGQLSWNAVDPERGTLFVTINNATQIAKVVDGRAAHTIALPAGVALDYWDDYLAGATPNGELIVSSVGDGVVQRLTYQRVTPSFVAQPADAAPAIRTPGGTVATQFSVELAGDPAPAVRWQTRVPGVSRWGDLADGARVSGAATTTLNVTVDAADGGRQYRAVATNAAGELASARATLDVKTLPQVVVQPLSLSVVEGGATVFRVMPSGNPEPAIQWQRRVGGFWTDVPADADEFTLDGGVLTVVDPVAEMSGAQFRARLRNEVGTVYTQPVSLTVSRALSEPATFGGGWVEWGVAERWRCYVVGNVARGGIVVAGGAEQVPGTLASGTLCNGRNAGSERLRFPLRGGTYDPASGRATFTLGGSVRFWGHDYHVPGDTRPQLDTTFSNLRIVLDGGVGTLYADAVGGTMDSPAPVTRTGVALVSVDLTGSGAAPFEGGLGWNALPTTLTAAGAEVFGSYSAGETFDPLTISALFGTPQVDPEPGPAPLPSPPAPLPAPLPAPTPTPAPAAVARVTVPKAAL